MFDPGKSVPKTKSNVSCHTAASSPYRHFQYGEYHGDEVGAWVSSGIFVHCCACAPDNPRYEALTVVVLIIDIHYIYCVLISDEC